MIALQPVPASDAPGLAAALSDYFTELALAPLPDPAPVAARQFGPDRLPYWVTQSGQTVGFALAFRHADGLLELAEFRIHTSARRKGLGTAAADALFRRHTGAWQLGVFDSPAATRFWDHCLHGLPCVTGLAKGPALTAAQSHSYRFETRA